VKTEKKLASKEATFWFYLIWCESIFQKTPIIANEERAVQLGDAFEDTAFQPGIEIVKF
jgi:hypothetical protein